MPVSRLPKDGATACSRGLLTADPRGHDIRTTPRTSTQGVALHSRDLPSLRPQSASFDPATQPRARIRLRETVGNVRGTRPNMNADPNVSVVIATRNRWP